MRKLLPLLLAIATFSAATAFAGGSGSEGGPHQPSLTNVRGVWVMHLFGSRAQMARQHGALVRGHVDSTALPFFARKIANAINQSYLVKDVPALGPLAREAIDLWVATPLRRGLPKEDRLSYEAFAEASGFGLRDTLNAAVVPDVGQWLTSSIFSGNRPTLGCSSVVLPQGPEGLIHARNLDYEGYGIFDSSPVVIYFHPENERGEPDGQEYMSVSSLGIHTAGITAHNASGLTLDLHQTMVSAVSRHGTPILSITSRVVREARTLREAIAILQDAKYAGSWLIVLSSAREHDAAVVEVSADGAAVRFMSGDHLAATNHVLTPWMARKEFSVDHGFYTSSRERLALLDREAGEAAGRGGATAQAAIDMISTSPVSLITNIQSVAFVPERNLVYVAVDPLDHARPLDGTYVALPIDWKAPGGGAAGAAPDLTRGNPLTREQIEASALLRRAAQLSTEEGRYAEAAGLLNEATAKDPADATYPLLDAFTLARALPSLKDHSLRPATIESAQGLLRESIRRGMPPYQVSLAHLMLGRLADVAGSREAAVGEYAQVDQKLWKPLGKAAAAGLHGRYGISELRKIVVDYERNDLFRF